MRGLLAVREVGNAPSAAKALAMLGSPFWLPFPPHEQSSGNAGVATNAPHPRRVEVIDFNGDGAPDFAMQAHLPLPPNLPLVWLNDGRGRFSALRCMTSSPRLPTTSGGGGSAMALSVAAQPRVGARPIDERQGGQYGWAVDYETV